MQRDRPRALYIRIACTPLPVRRFITSLARRVSWSLMPIGSPTAGSCLRLDPDLQPVACKYLCIRMYGFWGQIWSHSWYVLFKKNVFYFQLYLHSEKFLRQAVGVIELTSTMSSKHTSTMLSKLGPRSVHDIYLKPFCRFRSADIGWRCLFTCFFFLFCPTVRARKDEHGLVTGLLRWPTSPEVRSRAQFFKSRAYTVFFSRTLGFLLFVANARYNAFTAITKPPCFFFVFAATACTIYKFQLLAANYYEGLFLVVGPGRSLLF